MYDIKNLEDLFITGPGVTGNYEVSQELAKRKKLVNLALSIPAVISFHESVKDLKSLRQIMIFRSTNESLPKNIEHITSLQELDFTNNANTDGMMAGIESMENLEILRFEVAKEDDLPRSIPRPKNLKEVVIVTEEAVSLPASYAKLIEEIDVDLEGCKLVPDGSDGRLGQKQVDEIMGKKDSAQKEKNKNQGETSTAMPSLGKTAILWIATILTLLAAVGIIFWAEKRNSMRSQ